MSGQTHGGKGDERRPEAEAGAYSRGFDAIDWNARDREAGKGGEVPDNPNGVNA